MYFKLAYRNIRRSLRDYIIYFVTLTLTAALMYSFLALGFSPDILAMAENMSIRFRYPFFSPTPHDVNLGSRFGVRRQLRPSWTFTTD